MSLFCVAALASADFVRAETQAIGRFNVRDVTLMKTLVPSGFTRPLVFFLWACFYQWKKIHAKAVGRMSINFFLPFFGSRAQRESLY